MVEVPALKLDGQNWKIYCTRILEVAATLEVLEVLRPSLDTGKTLVSTFNIQIQRLCDSLT